jgi:hypothetical protein
MLTKLSGALSRASAVKKRTRKGILRQFFEILDLRLSANCWLGMGEYYDLGLFDERYTQAERRRFGGWRLLTHFEKRLKNEAWQVFSYDKVAFQIYAHAVGVPVPDTIAIITSQKRSTGIFQNISDRMSIANLLADASLYPLFVKPAASWYGRGARLAESLLQGQGRVKMAGDQTLSLENLVDYCQELASSPRYKGCIIQRVLHPHRALVALAGDRVSGIRIGVAWGNASPEVYRAVLKVNRGDRITDNFDHGRSGNLLADVDVRSGKLKRVVCGVGLETASLEAHPVTGHTFADFVIPHWDSVVEVCLQLARAFPRMRLLGVDVAVTDPGPVVLEVNYPGDFDLLQIAAQRGVMAEDSVRRLFV